MMGYYYVTGPQTPIITKNATLNSWPSSFYCHALRDGRHGQKSIGTPRGAIYNVYVRWLLLPVLCIGGMTITSGYDWVR